MVWDSWDRVTMMPVSSATTAAHVEASRTVIRHGHSLRTGSLRLALTTSQARSRSANESSARGNRSVLLLTETLRWFHSGSSILLPQAFFAT